MIGIMRGGEPGPVAPITEVRRTIEFAIERVSQEEKLYLEYLYTDMIG